MSTETSSSDLIKFNNNIIPNNQEEKLKRSKTSDNESFITNNNEFSPNNDKPSERKTASCYTKFENFTMNKNLNSNSTPSNTNHHLISNSPTNILPIKSSNNQISNYYSLSYFQKLRKEAQQKLHNIIEKNKLEYNKEDC